MRTLTPEGWREVSPYLDQVLSLPEDERAPWLESFRAERPDLVDFLQAFKTFWKSTALWHTSNFWNALRFRALLSPL